jgi:hypothetical protein
VHICYLDDSGDEAVRAFSLISVPVSEWRKCFNAVKDYRRRLRQRDGIFIKKEFHATEFVAGRGHIANRDISKTRRCEIYRECIGEIARLPGIRLFNAIGPKQHERRIFERLMNRLNRALLEWDSQAICVSDEGKDYNRLVRQMNVFNPIPSMFGLWPDGRTKNIVIGRIVEQLFYRKSEESYFIQMADFCAYALLRSERHLASKNAYNLHTCFDLLEPICQKQCYGRDPRKLGIIRHN